MRCWLIHSFWYMLAINLVKRAGDMKHDDGPDQAISCLENCDTAHGDAQFSQHAVGARHCKDLIGNGKVFLVFCSFDIGNICTLSLSES